MKMLHIVVLPHSDRDTTRTADGLRQEWVQLLITYVYLGKHLYIPENEMNHDTTTYLGRYKHEILLPH